MSLNSVWPIVSRLGGGASGWLALSLFLFASLAQAAAPKPSEGFDYFENNWNVVGLKDYPRGARVTPDNRIFLAGTNATVQVRFGSALTPLSRKQTKLALNGWMPIMVVSADDGPVHYQFTYWATPMPEVKNWRKAYDWPTEGALPSHQRIRSARQGDV